MNFQEECLALLKTSKNQLDWDVNTDYIKSQYGGDYPRWWVREVAWPDLLGQLKAKWLEKNIL